MFMVLFFTSTLLAVKKNGPPSTKKSRRLSGDALTPPHLRTLEDWQALSRETLTLSANAVNVPSTGTSGVLADLLYRFYNPDVPVVPQASDSSPAFTAAPPVTSASSSANVSLVNTFSSPRCAVSDATSISTDSIQQQIASAVADAVGPLYSLLANRMNGSIPPPSPHLILPNQQDRTNTMPAVPHSVLEKIRRGEFIHLDQLLPNNVPSEVSTSYSLSLDSNDNNSAPRISISNSLQNTKNKIFDLFTWLLAWTLFCQVFLIFNADFAQQLIKYQLFIAQLASSYNFQAWYSYDQAFRLFLANNPGSRWDVCNEDIYNVHLRGAQGRSRCFSCGGRDHFSASCPKRRMPTSSPSASSQRASFSTASSSAPFFRNQPFLAPQVVRSAAQSKEFCRNFNFKSCTFPNCSRIHRCLKCNQKHPASSCQNSHL